MSIRNDTDELIAFLDSLAKIDPVAMGALIAARVPCNEALANHPTVQCGAPEGVANVGVLGLLNGYAGGGAHIRAKARHRDVAGDAAQAMSEQRTGGHG